MSSHGLFGSCHRLLATTVVLAILGTLLTVAAPLLGSELLAGNGENGEDLSSRLRGWTADPRIWILPAFLGMLVFAVYGWTMIQLRGRSRELRQEFRDRYHSPEDTD